MGNHVASNQARVQKLIASGVNILAPESVLVGEEVNLNNLEAGVVIGPAIKILGAETMIGAGTEIQGAAIIKNSLIGRNCSLAAGEDADSPCLLVNPEDAPVRLVVVDDCHGPVFPLRMLAKNELEWERGKINTSHPVHGMPPPTPDLPGASHRRNDRSRNACP